MLDGVEKTADNTIKTIKNIKRDMNVIKRKLRKECSFYSKDLLECIFSKPYTTQRDLIKKLNVSKPTAKKYLDELCNNGILFVEKNSGVESKYYNKNLVKILKKSLTDEKNN